MYDVSTPPSPSPQSRSSLMYVLGALVGGFVGFVMRPAVFLVGQLPFKVVISRGTNLEGLSAVLIPAAQQSFNYMALGFLVGLAVVHMLMHVNRQDNSQGKAEDKHER